MATQARPFPASEERSFTFSNSTWFSFRPLSLADEAILHRVCWPEKSSLEAHDLMTRALKLQNQGRGGALVALVDGQVCAFGMMTRWPELGEISDLVVRADLRSCGLGTALIAELSKLAYHLHVRTLEIGAYASNTRALALYQRLGFVEQRRLEIRMASRPETIIYLRKVIEE